MVTLEKERCERLGVGVDNLTEGELLDKEEEFIETAPPEEVVAGGGDYIRGVAKLDDRLIILVDLVRILAQELREGPALPASF